MAKNIERKGNGYAYSKQWFEFTFETEEMVTPIHTALYFWIVELNNKVQWKPVFGLPTDYSMKAVGLKCYKSYKRALDDLIKWGFIRLIRKSRNQHTCNEVALVLKTKAQPKQRPKQYQSTATIVKQEETIKTIKTFFSEKVNFVFNDFLEQEENNKRPVTEARLKTLVEHLNNIATTDEEKIAVIKQAIAGNYPDFRPLPANSARRNDKNVNDLWITSQDPLPHTPVVEDFILFLEENGHSKELAERIFYDFAYNKNWKDKAGFSIKENWKEILIKNDFYDKK